MNDRALEELAARVEACVADAKRPEPMYGLDGATQYGIVIPDARIVSLANGLEAVAAALRAIAGKEG